MNVIEKYLTLFPGTFTVSDSDLILTVPLKVKREGTGFKIKTVAPSTGREVYHNRATGELTFLIAGTVGATDISNEQIYVLIKQP